MRPLFDTIRSGFVPMTGPRGQRLSLLNVVDLAAAVVSWTRQPQLDGGSVFTLDDGRENGYSWEEMIAALRPRRGCLKLPIPRSLLALIGRANLLVSRIFRYQPMLTPGKVRELSEPHWLCNNHALTQALSWRPTLSLADGLRELYDASAERS